MKSERGLRMKCIRTWLILAFLIVQSAAAQQKNAALAAGRDEYLKGYDQRAHYITAAFDTAGGYYGIAARYEHNVNIRQADSMFIEVMREPRGVMFWMFPVIGSYLHGKDKMSDAARAA